MAAALVVLVGLNGCQSLAARGATASFPENNPFTLAIPPVDADRGERQAFYDHNAPQLGQAGKAFSVNGVSLPLGSLKSLFADRGELSYVEATKPHYGDRLMFGLEAVACAAIAGAAAPRAGDSSNGGFGSYQDFFIIGVTGTIVTLLGYWYVSPDLPGAIASYDRNLADRLGLAPQSKR